MTEVVLSPFESILSVGNLWIGSVAWNNVVSWVDAIFVSSEIGFKVVGQLFFSVFDVLFGVHNFMGFSEIWDNVVNWVTSICWSLMHF